MFTTHIDSNTFGRMLCWLHLSCMSAMYVCESCIFCNHRAAAALRKARLAAKAEQEGLDEAAEHDSDSDDSRPLGELVKVLDPSQLAAKRTPFLAAAQTATSEASDDAVHAERCDSVYSCRWSAFNEQSCMQLEVTVVRLLSISAAEVSQLLCWLLHLSMLR